MAKKKKTKTKTKKTAKSFPDWMNGTIHISSVTHGPADDDKMTVRIRLVVALGRGEFRSEVLDIDMDSEEFTSALFGTRTACKIRKG